MLEALVLLTIEFPQVFEEYVPTILPSSVNYFFMSLSLLTGVIRFKHTPFFNLFVRACNPKGTVTVFLHKETAIYYK